MRSSAFVKTVNDVAFDNGTIVSWHAVRPSEVAEVVRLPVRILKAVVSKNHRAIVVDEDKSVLYTNFPITGTVTTDGKLHLLDVIDSQQQDVLRLVGVALDRPNQVVEADTMFRSEPCHVKAVHLEEEGELRRTLILFETKTVGARI